MEPLKPRFQPVVVGDHGHGVGLSDLKPATEASPLTWYVCGPTVYDVAHIGHARTYVCFDIIHRVLTDLFARPVFLAMGVTDVDDKIISGAARRGVDWRLLARYYEQSFLADMRALNVRRPSALLRVTEHMDDIRLFIKAVLDRGLAYRTADGVYFSVDAFAAAGHRYGKLQFDEAEAARAAALAAATPSPGPSPSTEAPAVSGAVAGAAVVGGAGQGNPADFALWKAAKPGEPSWPSEWGPGRPGWHIECSAMTDATFGPALDVHGGGVDLKFPHHCNEVAQCEARHGWGGEASGTSVGAGRASAGEWCRAWLHTGHLHIEGLKMSKSLKNFVSVRQMLARGHGADAFRMFCLQSHYRSGVDYSEDRLTIAQAALDRFANFFSLVRRHVDAADTRDAALADSLAAIFETPAVVAVATPPPAPTVPAATAPASAPVDAEAVLAGAGSWHRWGAAERALHAALGEAQAAVLAGLRDDFRTPVALHALHGLVSAPNAYVAEASAAGPESPSAAQQASGFPAPAPQPSPALLLRVGEYVRGILRVFGLAFVEQPGLLRAPLIGVPGTAGESGFGSEEAVDAFARFRSDVRNAALEARPTKAAVKAAAAEAAASAEHPTLRLKALCDAVLVRCDAARDQAFPALGFALRDIPAQAALPGARPFEVRRVRQGRLELELYSERAKENVY